MLTHLANMPRDEARAGLGAILFDKDFDGEHMPTGTDATV
jgi:hypothetical protein